LVWIALGDIITKVSTFMVDRLGSEHFKTHLELKGGGIHTYFSFSSKTICSSSSVSKIAQFDKGMENIRGVWCKGFSVQGWVK
jgi:hypothetical protein